MTVSTDILTFLNKNENMPLLMKWAFPIYHALPVKEKP